MNNYNINLLNACKNLNYTKNKDLTSNVISETELKLDKLYNEYGFARTITALSKVWSLDKACEFFYLIKPKKQNDKKPKVIATYYRRAYNGGIERVNSELMDIFIKMGYKVIFFSEEKENEFDFPYPDKVKRIIIPTSDNIYERLLSIEKHCKEEKIDIFINNAWWDYSFVWICALFQKMNIPIINYCHGYFTACFKERVTDFIEIKLLRLYDLMLCLSDVNSKFYQYCGINNYLINNPIPKDIKNVDIRKNINKHILYVGRLSKDKNLNDLFKIFKKVLEIHKDAILDVVGGGESEEEIINYANSFGIEKSIVFHGLKDYIEIKDYYKNSSLLLFTSKMEGYPMTLLEAKAYGLPIVMYDLSYLTLIKDKKGVLVSDIGDIDNMANNVINILSDEDLNNKLTNDARESFKYFLNYDIEKHWINIFDICTNKNDLDFENYYKSNDASDIDKRIISDLFNGFEEGCIYSLNKNIDYKIGKILLKGPRFFKRILKKLGEVLHG